MATVSTSSPEDIFLGQLLRLPAPTSAPLQEPDPLLDRPTFAAVYRSSLRYVLGLLGYLGVPERDREDVAHEVFLVVHRRLDEYDPALNLRAWLGGITWRTARRFLERARKHVEGADDAAASLQRLDETMQDPEARMAAAEMEELLRQIVSRVVQTLPEERRIVLVMHDLEGLGMRDIAAALSIPENTGWDRLRRARRDFRAAVQRLTKRDRTLLGILAPLLPLPLDPDVVLQRIPTLPDVPEGLEERLWSRLLSSPEIGDGGGPPTSRGTRPPAPRAAPSAGITTAKLVAGAVFVFVLGGLAGAGLLLLLVRDRDDARRRGFTETSTAPLVTAEVLAAGSDAGVIEGPLTAAATTNGTPSGRFFIRMIFLSPHPAAADLAVNLNRNAVRGQSTLSAKSELRGARVLSLHTGGLPGLLARAAPSRERRTAPSRGRQTIRWSQRRYTARLIGCRSAGGDQSRYVGSARGAPAAALTSR
ncbi:MAG: sigma-70 family RNA polymerase sigma factor [Minicystis sp.]